VLREFSRVLGKNYEDEFKKADQNKDGRLSEKELVHWVDVLTDKHKDEKEESVITQPTRKQYFAAFINQMVPFLGFGFMDNFIMILAGDQIDATFGVTLGISTMAAAGEKRKYNITLIS
jgi:hypothetical protein